MQMSDLPALNAALNSCVAILLLLARPAILAGNENRHRALMLAATTLSAIFLISYLTYHYNYGSTPFTGLGLVRILYFTILISHTILAAMVAPLVIVTVTLALRGHHKRHRRLARFTWPMWLYVSVTGVLIYLMLYQL